MEEEQVIAVIGRQILQDLIYCYKNNCPYYLKNTVNYLFKDEVDALFITDEEILDYVKRILADEYELIINQVQRVHKSEDISKEDFTYEDTEVKIKLKSND